MDMSAGSALLTAHLVKRFLGDALDIPAQSATALPALDFFRKAPGTTAL